MKLLFLSLFIAFTSCVTTKGKDGEKGKDGKSATTQTTKVSPESMKEKGFISGTFTKSRTRAEGEPCSHILNIEGYKDNLDPINLDKFYKEDIPQKVWVKFSSLRMRNRCDEARPITITEIQKRE